jgi:ferredoxin
VFSLLDALEAQEIPAPYCFRGWFCGTCMVRLLDGEVETVLVCLVDLHDDEILTCCCKPITHIEIELASE